MGTCEKFPGGQNFGRMLNVSDTEVIVRGRTLCEKVDLFIVFIMFISDSLTTRRFDVRSGSMRLSYVIKFDCGGQRAIAILWSHGVVLPIVSFSVHLNR
jgi:hypothetical protein